MFHGDRIFVQCDKYNDVSISGRFFVFFLSFFVCVEMQNRLVDNVIQKEKKERS